MSTRYHVNPETGRANICSAKIKCDFAVDGVEPQHYASKDDAKAGYEKDASQEFGNTASLSKKSKQKDSYYDVSQKSVPKSEVNTLSNFMQTIDSINIKYPYRLEMSREETKKILDEKSKARKDFFSNSDDTNIQKFLDNKNGKGFNRLTVEDQFNISNNPNTSEKTLEKIANEHTGGSVRGPFPTNQKYIEKMLNSSRAHNRTTMFYNPNVNPDDLYAMTKKYSDSKYSKEKIKMLSDKGYDMSHIGKKPQMDNSNSVNTNKKPTSNVDEAFDNITQQMNQLDKDKLVRLSQREGIKIPPAYKKMLETGNYDTKSTKGKISVIDTFTRAKFVTEGRRAFTGTGDSNNIARHIISIGKMPRETKEEQAKVIKEYNRINSMIDGQIEFDKGRQERLRERKLKVAQGKIRRRD